MHFTDINIIGASDDLSYCTTSNQLYKYLQEPRYTLFEFEAVTGRGYMYHIATNGGTTPWENPHTSKQVEVSASTVSPVATYSRVEHVVYFESAGNFGTSHNLKIQNDPHWVVIDLKSNAPICPNCYALKGCKIGGLGFELRNWLFQGSNNNVYWTTLREHVNDMKMVNNGALFSWAIDKCTQFYRYFRIYAIGKQQNTEYNMVAIGGFEIYGKVRQ